MDKRTQAALADAAAFLASIVLNRSRSPVHAAEDRARLTSELEGMVLMLDRLTTWVYNNAALEGTTSAVSYQRRDAARSAVEAAIRRVLPGWPEWRPEWMQSATTGLPQIPVSMAPGCPPRNRQIVFYKGAPPWAQGPVTFNGPPAAADNPMLTLHLMFLGSTGVTDQHRQLPAETAWKMAANALLVSIHDNLPRTVNQPGHDLLQQAFDILSTADIPYDERTKQARQLWRRYILENTTRLLAPSRTQPGLLLDVDVLDQ